MAKKVTKEEIKLAREVKQLTKSVTKLKNLEFVKILNRPWRMMWLALLKGIMVGFGTVIGASVVVAIFIYIIAKISFVPIVGDFVQDVISEVKSVSDQQVEGLEGEK